MKKLIFTFMCFTAGVGITQAQNETLTLRAVKKGEEPKEVMEAIRQDFPKGIVGDLRYLSSRLYGERWAVNFQDNLDGTTPDFYQVNLREGNERYSAVYDKNGKMLSSKTVIKHAEMPIEVTQAISFTYRDWKVLDDSEKITYKSGVLREVFRVEIQQDTNFRMLFVDTAGNVLKDFSEIPYK